MRSFVWRIATGGKFLERPLDFHENRNQLFKKLGMPYSAKNYQSKPAIISNLAYIKACITNQPGLVINEKLKLSYLRIPKTGSTSILSQMVDHHPVESGSFNNEEIEAIAFYQTKWRYSSKLDLTTFTTVRNPFVKIVSVYKSIFEENRPFLYQGFLFGIFKRDFTFYEFLKTISIIPKLLSDQHFKPMTTIIKHSRIRDMKWFKIEEPVELEQFLTGFNLKLVHLNQGSKTEDYRDYF